MRWYHGVLGAVGLAFVVLVGVVVYVATLDLDRYRAEIRSALETRVGMPVTLDGPVALAWRPAPTLTVEGVTIANTDWAEAQSLASIESLSITVELLPLLSRSLVIRRATLSGVAVHLERNAGGGGNWRGLALSGPVPGTGGTGGGLVRADLAALSVEDMLVTWKPGPDADRSSYRLDALGLATGGASGLDLNLTGTIGEDAIELMGRIPSLADLLSVGVDLPVDLSGTVAGRPVSAAATLIRGEAGDASTARRIEAKEFTISVGDVSVSGTAALELDTPRPVLSATVAIGPLDLDSDASAAADDGLDPMLRPLPLDLLGAADADVTLSMERLASAGFAAEEIKAAITLQDAVLRIADLSARTQGGAFEGVAVFDATQEPPVVSFDGGLLGADLGAMLRDASGRDLLDARGDLGVRIEGRGDTVAEWVETLQGRSSLIVRKGVVRNAYWELIAEDLATRFLPMLDDSDRGRLNCAVAAADIEAGVARSQVILIDSDRVTIGGEGTVKLAARTIDLRLVPQPKDPSLISLATPILINGPLEDPSIAPDAAALAKDVGTAVVGGLINPLAVLLPFMSVGEAGDPCPGAIAVAEGKAPAGDSGDTENPGAIEGFFDKLREAIE